MTTLAGPLLAMMALTGAVWVYMFSRRLPFLAKLGPGLTASESKKQKESAPAAVMNPSDNLKNLFELPVLFYAVVLFLITRGGVPTTDVVLAWTFVGLRTLHSAVHCTFNHLILRFLLYLTSGVALFAIIGRAIFTLLTTSIASS